MELAPETHASPIPSSRRKMYLLGPGAPDLLLTLGAHARGLQYSFCLCVCLSVCLSVCFPYSGTSRNLAYIQTAVSATSARYGHEI